MTDARPGERPAPSVDNAVKMVAAVAKGLRAVLSRADSEALEAAIDGLRAALAAGGSPADGTPTRAAAPPDGAVYIAFTLRPEGTRMMATQGYNGPVIARLQWGRVLSPVEEGEINAVVREGAHGG